MSVAQYVGMSSTGHGLSVCLSVAVSLAGYGASSKCTLRNNVAFTAAVKQGIDVYPHGILSPLIMYFI
jgi:hypothetical protein